MKHFRVLCVSVMIVAASSSHADLRPGTGVTGSFHDIGRYFNLSDRREACVYCHSGIHARATYRQRSPASEDANVHEGATLICLSCHDGALATDIPAGHHRVGFVYDPARGAAYCGPNAAQAAGTRCELKDKDARFAGTDMTISERLWQVQVGDERLIMTCATCHDPHNKGSDSTLDEENHLLVAPQAGGALCLSCHTATVKE